METTQEDAGSVSGVAGKAPLTPLKRIRLSLFLLCKFAQFLQVLISLGLPSRRHKGISWLSAIALSSLWCSLLVFLLEEPNKVGISSWHKMRVIIMYLLIESLVD